LFTFPSALYGGTYFVRVYCFRIYSSSEDSTWFLALYTTIDLFTSREFLVFVTLSANFCSSVMTFDFWLSLVGYLKVRGLWDFIFWTFFASRNGVWFFCASSPTPFLSWSPLSAIRAALSLLVLFCTGYIMFLEVWASGMASFKFNFIKLLLILSPCLPDPDRGVDVLVNFIRLRGVMQSELVGLRFKALSDVVDETSESLFADLGIISLTIERLRLTTLTGGTYIWSVEGDWS